MAEWEKDLWATSFAKLDKLGFLLCAQTDSVNAISREMAGLKKGTLSADQAMVNLKGALRQANARSLIEMHGLSRSQAAPLQLKSIFVAPQLVVSSDQHKRSLDDEDAIIKELTYTGKTYRILGPAGCGKTTLSKWLEEWFWRSTQRLAIRCELRTIAQNDELPSMLQLLETVIPAETRGTSTTDDFARWINEGLILTIFDGFDEVPPEKRDAIKDWINTIRSSVDDGNSFIVTSRNLTTNQLEDEFWLDAPLLRVPGFDQPRVLMYIDKWQQSMLQPEEREALHVSEQPNALTEVFMAAPTIQELTSNPLLLSTLMIVHRFEKKKLPDGRSDLYRVYIDGMLGQWYNKTGDSHEIVLSANDMRRLLRTLAANMQVQDIASVNEKTAIEWLNDENTTGHDTAAVLEYMLERAGLLIGPGQYQFAHKSIGEFLVAQAIIAEQVRVDDVLLDRMFLLDKATEDQWRVVLFLWAGLVESALDLLSFSKQLIQTKQPVVALGILLDRGDAILKDHPAELEKAIFAALALPQDGILDVEGSAYYCGMDSSWPDLPGCYKIKSLGYLTISGVEHFKSKLIRQCFRQGLLQPQKKLVQKNSLYFEVWATWIEEGVPYDALFSLAPEWLDRDQILTAIIQYRRTNLRIDDFSEPKLQPLFQPWIIDRIVGTIVGRYRLGDEDDDEEKYENKKEMEFALSYVETIPMQSWPDALFRIRIDRDTMHFNHNNDKNFWDPNTGFPKIEKLEPILKKRLSNSPWQDLSIVEDFLTQRASTSIDAGIDWVQEHDEATLDAPINSAAELWGEEAISSVVEAVRNEISMNGVALHLVDQ